VVIRPAPTGGTDTKHCVSRPAADRPTASHPGHKRPAASTPEIDVEDARHEHVKAFTFGGTLHLDSDARRTICQLVSPAPLLEHARELSSLEENLIEEVQILFAERRAVQDDDAFDRRLAAADPLQLYRACLVALNEKFAHFPSTDDAQRPFKQFLHSATQSLEAEVVPALAELL
jgi:hypothetical protein